MAGRRILVIEDNKNHLDVWCEIVEAQGWECVPVLATTVDEVLDGIGRMLSSGLDDCDATILDVMFGGGREYEGINAFREAVGLYEKERFGHVVVASGKEWGDDVVSAFVKEFRAIRCASPLSQNSSDVMTVLRTRFKDKPLRR